MKHSRMYKEVMRWVGEIGTEEGYFNFYCNIFDKMHDWERDEVEAVIYEKFITDAMYIEYFAMHMPNLKNYDGIEALKKYLKERGENQRDIIMVASALYNATLESQYVDIMMDIYKNNPNLRYVSVISDCKPSEALFEALADIYVNNGDETIWSTAGDGMLHCKGYFHESGFQCEKEISEEEIELGRLFLNAEDIEERKMLAEKLATNQQLTDGIPVPEPLY